MEKKDANKMIDAIRSSIDDIEKRNNGRMAIYSHSSIITFAIGIAMITIGFICDMPGWYNLVCIFPVLIVYLCYLGGNTCLKLKMFLELNKEITDKLKQKMNENE